MKQTYGFQAIVNDEMPILMRADIEADLKRKCVELLVEKIETVGLAYSRSHNVRIRQTWEDSPALHDTISHSLIPPRHQAVCYTIEIQDEPAPRLVHISHFVDRTVEPKFKNPLARLFYWAAKKLEGYR